MLGDYFDTWGDSDFEAINTATWLRDVVLPNKKIVPLIGNHDTHYFYKDNHHLRCSGYSNSKNKFINEILTDDHKSMFSWYTIDSGFLFTHAGLSSAQWKTISVGEQRENSLEVVDEILKDAVIANDKIAKDGKDAPLFSAGWDRGGFNRNGGINWVDWNSFAPVKNINQIVGHTRHKVPHILVQQRGGGIYEAPITDYYRGNKNFKNPLSVNYAIDTDSNHYMVIEDGKIDIYDTMHHMNLKDVINTSVTDSEMNNLT